MIAPRVRAPYPQTVSLSKLLLVEGETPAHFFEALAVHLSIDKTIEIRSFGGNQNLQNVLSALVNSHGFSATVKSLGIARDAEADANAARQSVDSVVQQSRVPRQITVRITILPDNTSPGMIETLCLQSVTGKPFFPCIEQYIANAQQHGATFPAGLALDKSRLQVYMAAHPTPQLHPGIAASRGYWPFGDSIFQGLKAFLQSL